MFIKGAQIGPSLKNLAERRTDIFGSEETVIGRKVCTYVYIYMHICTTDATIYRYIAIS